ncbi:MAG: SPFH domain-containing protein [Anaerolineae bacterium]|nr:SPFH domain-containing protein [Anaerolineae bacterium]
MPRLIDVLSHPNVGPEELAWREPQAGNGDWRMGSQVIVGPSQAAVFVYRGQVQDILREGAHTLSTMNLPILASVIGLATSGRTPFTADLYFVNLRDMPQVGWGTNPPIPLETPGKGMGVVLLQGHGVVDIGVEDAGRFVRQYAINSPATYLRDIRDRIQAMLLGQLTSILMKSGAQSVPDVNRVLGELEGAALAMLNEEFQAMGLRIKAFESQPFQAKTVSEDELRDYVNLDQWERVKRMSIAQAAASNEGAGGTLASAGLGLGLGQQMGAVLNPDAAAMQQQLMQQQLMMNQMMNQMMQNQAAPQPATAPPATGSVPQTKAEIQAMIDGLDVKLMNGEISEATYQRLLEKWQARLQELGG